MRSDCWRNPWRQVDGAWQFVESPLRVAAVADLRSYLWLKPRIPPDTLAEWTDQAGRRNHTSPFVAVAERPVALGLEPGWSAVIEKHYAHFAPEIRLARSWDDLELPCGSLPVPAMLDESVAPHLRRCIRRTRERAPVPHSQHTKGSEFRSMDSLMDCIVAILIPIQPRLWRWNRGLSRFRRATHSSSAVARTDDKCPNSQLWRRAEEMRDRGAVRAPWRPKRRRPHP